jgi:AcrR family transcriptional regulator
MLDDSEQPDVSVLTLAARARVSSTALCAHFPSIDTVFAELYLQLVTALPLVVDPTARIEMRVSTQLRAITLILADRPGMARACTRALLSTDDPTVAHVRTRIAAEVRRRLAAAMGTGAWPEVLTTLETVFWGALLQSQARHIGYRTTADHLDTMLSLILPGAGDSLRSP